MIRPMTDALLLAGAFLGGFLVCAGVAVAVLRVLFDLHREDRRMVEAEREHWRSERRELVTRALHPQIVPTGVPRAQRDPDELTLRRQQAADYATVGRLVPASTERNGDGDDLELP
jgi:hypothetical protein